MTEIKRYKNLLIVLRLIESAFPELTHYACFEAMYVPQHDYCYDFAAVVVDVLVRLDAGDVMHTMAHQLVNNHYVFLCRSKYVNRPKP